MSSKIHIGDKTDKAKDKSGTRIQRRRSAELNPQLLKNINNNEDIPKIRRGYSSSSLDTIRNNSSPSSTPRDGTTSRRNSAPFLPWQGSLKERRGSLDQGRVLPFKKKVTFSQQLVDPRPEPIVKQSTFMNDGDYNEDYYNNYSNTYTGNENSMMNSIPVRIIRRGNKYKMNREKNNTLSDMMGCGNSITSCVVS